MIMADVFKILFLILGTLIVTVSYWLLFEALFPVWVGRAQQALYRHPVRVLAWGVGFTVPLLVLGLLLANAPAQLKLAGVIVLGGLFLAGLMGATGLARLIGHRLPGALDATQPWRRVLRGGIVLSLTFVMPLVGWFFVMPLTLVLGIGALAVARRLPVAQPAVAVVPATNTNAVQA